ncbi:MAG: TRAP transporter substrate-binding protein [Verrucomicrobiales bacterium]|nr:TRAP transporter substrate-binding protein [Verrucomicrobiota bacterium JB025]
MKKSTSFFLSGILIGIVVSCLAFAMIMRSQMSGDGGSAVRARTLKFAHGMPTTHPVHQGVQHMSEKLRELSGGRMKLVIFPAEQMGDETKCLEQVQMGTLTMTKTSSAPMGNFVSLMKLFSLPYLFRDSGHYWKVLEGEIGRELLEKLATRDDGKKSGMVGLGYFDSGSRNFYGKEPLIGVESLKGKKIRVMPDPVAMDMVEALGATPESIPFGELYTALKQGVVDAAENNPPSIATTRHYEVCKHLTMDGHSRIPDVIVISDKVWAELTEEERGWLREAMASATAYQRKLWADATDASLEEMKEFGLQVYEVDTAPYQEAVKPVVEKYAEGEIKTFYDRIQEVK